jgi:hypothetical protein
MDMVAGSAPGVQHERLEQPARSGITRPTNLEHDLAWRRGDTPESEIDLGYSGERGSASNKDQSTARHLQLAKLWLHLSDLFQALANWGTATLALSKLHLQPRIDRIPP